jgi:ssDNA-binding Zn-finger/Zn-ribbon topoisomerase 1
MDLVDSKYIGLVSSRLQKFKRVKADLYNFRCPICGDSQKHKNKARGYFYLVKTNTNYKCHNCGASLSFNNFLKQIDPTLHKQYTMEKFKSGHTGKNFVVDEPKFDFKKPSFKKDLDLPKASEVPAARKYLEKRKLDSTQFYYASEFMKWVNTQKKTFDTIRRDESRIIIPMYDTERNLIGFQGRSLVPNSVKYITVMLDEEAPKVYGLDKINKGETVYVVEGPFDSTFVSNSVAMCGSDSSLACLEGSSIVYVYDNEPRNKEIVGKIEKCINRGERVIIWPLGIEQKDINDMVLVGHDIMSMLQSNIYSNLEAKIKFNNWKKV